jgi:hypothetical protein
MTAHIMFQGPSLICQDCRAEIGQHHKPGCPEAGVRPARPTPPDGEAALLIKLFDECARLEAYEDALRGEGSKDIFRTTAATQLLWTQVRLVASTYRALVASGALPEVDPSAGPPGVTRLEFVEPDEAQAEARLHSTRVDCGALKAAAETLHAHRQLIIDACVDLNPDDRYDAADDVTGVSPTRYSTDALHDVVAAIGHVVDGDFRSPETRGGS